MKLKTQEECYWLRIKHRLPWSEISMICGLPKSSSSYSYAKTYCSRNRLPWPMVPSHCFGQDVYIDRTNGKTWMEISRKYSRPMSEAKNESYQWARRHGYRWPPYRGSI